MDVNRHNQILQTVRQTTEVDRAAKSLLQLITRVARDEAEIHNYIEFVPTVKNEFDFFIIAHHYKMLARYRQVQIGENLAGRYEIFAMDYRTFDEDCFSTQASFSFDFNHFGTVSIGTQQIKCSGDPAYYERERETFAIFIVGEIRDAMLKSQVRMVNSAPR